MLMLLLEAWVSRFVATIEWIWQVFVGDVSETALALVVGYVVWHYAHQHRWFPFQPPRPNQFWRFLMKLAGYGGPVLFLYIFASVFFPGLAEYLTIIGAALGWFLLKVYRPNPARLFTRLTSLPRFAFLGFLSFSRKPKDAILSGWKPLTARKLAEITTKEAPGILTLGGVPIPKYAEVTHLLFRGTTGVGKTKAILENLPRIREAGLPCVIVDPAGELMRRYYKPGDYILNPLDARSHKIDIRDYLTNSAACRSMATIVVPTNEATEDQKRWSQWAQNLLVPVFEAIKSGTRLSDELLVHMFTVEDKDKLKKRGFWTGSTAASVFLEGNEKWFSGMRGVLTEQLTFLTYPYPANAPKLNLNEWVDRSADTPHDSVLWLPFPREQREVLRPLYSIIISIVATRLMSLTDSDDRRMFFVLDELAKLGRVDKLKDLLEEGRKYGASVLACFQHPEQMALSFGQSAARIILSLFNTRILYRPADEEIAAKDSKRAGAYIAQRYTEGSSSNDGSSGSSSGQSFNEQITPELSAVPFTELLGLPNLHGYLLIQNHPPGKIVIPVKKNKSDNPDENTPFVIHADEQPRTPYVPPPEDNADDAKNDGNPTDPDNPDGKPKKEKRQTKRSLKPKPVPKDPDHLNSTVVTTEIPADEPTP